VATICRMPIPLRENQKATVEILRLEVGQRGLKPVADALHVHRTTLASVLVGSARPGTTLLVTERARALKLGGVGK
jgi:hypothetical protein